MKRPLIILTGPTAVGKTKLSIALAKAVNGSIISADSMQVYRHMDIGSAKIRPEEMDGVPHYLIDVLEPSEEFNVVKFQEMAKEAMEEIYRQGKIPVITGGTGFYIQAILRDIDFTQHEKEQEYRNELQELAKQKGGFILFQMLEEIDPVSAHAIHPNNLKRIIRALEYYHQTGQPISEHNEQEKKKDSPYQFAYFVLNDDRERLYQRIEERIDQMLEDGLLSEVKALSEMGYTRDFVSMQGLGYKEMLDYLDGCCPLEEAVYVLKRDTRHFAKRQLTWFHREKEVIWVNKPDYGYQEDKILETMAAVCREKGICKNPLENKTDE